jgi:hypothetical protein
MSEKMSLKRDYVAKIKELDLDDPNFENKFNQINRSYLSNTHYEHRNKIKPYYSIFGNHFRELSNIHDRINKMMYSNFNDFYNNDFDNNLFDNNLFIKDGEFDTNKLDELNINTEQDINTEHNTNTEQNTNTDHNKQNKSYYKYVSSMTTYDLDGNRKSKSISRSEKYDGKNKKITQISKIQDGNKYIEEYLQPDGTIKRVEKTINNQLT